MKPIVLTRWRIAALSAVGCLLLASLVFQPLAVRSAQRAARQRGWSANIAHASLGARGVWFKSVRITRERVPGLEFRLDSILVPWASIVTRSRVVVFGGTALLPEDLGAFRRELHEQRQLESNLAHSKLVLNVTGIDLRWPRVDQQGTSVFAWGISGTAADQNDDFHVDRLEVSRGVNAAAFIGTEFRLNRTNGELKLERAKAERANLTIQKREEVATSTSEQETTREATVATGPGKSSRKRAADAHSTKNADSSDAIQSLAKSLAGVQTGISSIRRLIARHLSDTGQLEIPNVGLKLSLGTQSLNVGPFQLQARNESGGLSVEMVQGSMGTDERRYFELRLPATPSQVDVRGEIGSVSLQALGVKESDFGLAHVDDAKLKLNLTASIDEAHSTATLRASGELSDVSLNQPWLASRTVSGINAEFSGNGEVGWGTGFSLRVNEMSLKLGQARVDVTADLQRVANETRSRVDVNVPLAACSALIESLPTGLAPLASQVKLEGTLSLQAGIVFDTEHPNKTDAKWDLANGCRVRGSSSQVAPERFREPFILEVPDARGVMVERAFGPGTPNWVPFSAMNSHLADAILVCEDGRFFNHGGFDSQAIRASIKDNLLRGKFMRGGSTVSMQLAKNLYLRREKTVSRKLQEAVLTLLLEQSFSKNDILELYWNVVELGPGVYGVNEASRFYFDTTPADLSTTQAFFLASILPNPKAMHFSADGSVFRGWLSQVRRLLTIAHTRKYLTDEELHEAIEEDLHFGSSAGNHAPAAAVSADPGDQSTNAPTDG